MMLAVNTECVCVQCDAMRFETKMTEVKARDMCLVQRIIIIEKRVYGETRQDTTRQMDINVYGSYQNYFTLRGDCVLMTAIATAFAPFRWHFRHCCHCCCCCCWWSWWLFKNTLYIYILRIYSFASHRVSFLPFGEWFCHSCRCTSWFFCLDHYER